jgi:hypothetical protein
MDDEPIPEDLGPKNLPFDAYCQALAPMRRERLRNLAADTGVSPQEFCEAIRDTGRVMSQCVVWLLITTDRFGMAPGGDVTLPRLAG